MNAVLLQSIFVLFSIYKEVKNVAVFRWNWITLPWGTQVVYILLGLFHA